MLGCSHYPFLRELLEEAVGDGVQIMETGEPVARQLANRLFEAGLLAGNSAEGRAEFWTSGSPLRLAPLFERLWGEPLGLSRLPV